MTAADRERYAWYAQQFGCIPNTDTITAQEAIALTEAGIPLCGQPQVNEPQWAEPAQEEREVNFAGFFTSAPSPAIMPPPLWTQGGVVDRIGDILEQVQIQGGFPAGIGQGSQIPAPTSSISTFASAGLGQLCWTNSDDPRTQRSRLRRRRIKVVGYQADGTPVFMGRCAPRRMNPLNPRALKRAAVRLGRFQSIASGIEKMIAKACKVKKSRRIPSIPSSCAPKRCR